MKDTEYDEIAGQVAVITGAASGIGRASVYEFLAAGAKVVAADLNHRVHGVFDDVPPDTRKRLKTYVADASIEADVAATIAIAVEHFGRFDIMFNNAGVGGAIGPLTDIDVVDWRMTFAILTESVFLGMKHAARYLIDRGNGGAIVNMASIAGLNGGVGPMAYSAAKAAVISMTQNAAIELAPHRIRVNGICPGAIYTPMLHAQNNETAARAIADIQPWPESGQPQHVAALVLFLCSARSEFITGQSLTIDGGLTAAGVRFRDLVPLGRHVGFVHGETGKPNQIWSSASARGT